MTNPRQRRKLKSSSYKPVSHSRHAKRNLKKMPPIRGPKLIQNAWDKNKTIRQNYAALGLIQDLNPTGSGGTEPTHLTPQATHINQSNLIPPEPDTTADIPKGYGKFIRDEAGNITGVQLAEEVEEGLSKQGGEALEEVFVESGVLHKWAGNSVRRTEQKLVAELEKISAPATATNTLAISISGVGARQSSSGEIAYLTRLVERYGRDVEKMAKDHKLNYDQRTAGQLRRALKRAGYEV